MNGSGTRLRDVCALRYDVAQSLLSAGGSLASLMASLEDGFVADRTVLRLLRIVIFRSASLRHPKVIPEPPPSAHNRLRNCPFNRGVTQNRTISPQNGSLKVQKGQLQKHPHTGSSGGTALPVPWALPSVSKPRGSWQRAGCSIKTAPQTNAAPPRVKNPSSEIPNPPRRSVRPPPGTRGRSHQLVQQRPDAGAGLCRPRHGLVAHGAHAAHLQPLHQAPAGGGGGKCEAEKPPWGGNPRSPLCRTHFRWKACWHGSTPSSSFALKSSRQTAQVCCGR